MPALAVQPVAPDEVNCWVAPSRRLAAAGATTGAGEAGFASVTIATPLPPKPVAVMRTLGDAGITEGAV